MNDYENDHNENYCDKNDCGCDVLDRNNDLCKEEIREIYLNLTSGKESVEILLPMSADESFRKELTEQDQAYTEMCARVERYAKEHSIPLKEVTPIAKGMMHMSATLNTLTDKSPSKLASIMLQGINMGTISITKIVNKIHEEGRRCPLADEMLDMLKHNAESMKKFL